MLNKIQINEKKVSTSNNTSKVITPLTRNITKDTSNDKLKELRRPRSRKYIKDLMELQELLIQLNQEHKKLEAKFTKEEDIKYRQDRLSAFELTERSLDYEKILLNQDIKKEIVDKKNHEIGYDIVDKKNHDMEYEVDEKNENEIIDRTHQNKDFSRSQIEEQVLNPEIWIFDDTTEDNCETNFEAEKILVEKSGVKLEENPIIEDLERRIQEKLQALEKENTFINELITFLYPSDKEEYLMDCGVIKRPGTPVYSSEDMVVGVEDPQIVERLVRGYDLYFDYCDDPDFLTLEIYIDAFCCIYKDGIVKTIV